MEQAPTGAVGPGDGWNGRREMAELLFDSLHIRNFRAFRYLEVPKLGRVNLLVGRNNTGKSSVLEALRIYARYGHPEAVWSVLAGRGESSRVWRTREAEVDIEQRVLDIKHILHKRCDLTGVQEIHIGSLKPQARQLTLSIGWYVTDERGGKTNQQVFFEELKELFLVIQASDRPEVSYNLARYFSRSLPPEEPRGIKHIFIPASGLDYPRIAGFWDEITLTDREEQVIQALKIIEPSIEGLSFIAGRATNRREPVMRTSQYNDRLPLRSLGEGVNRLLGIALALVNASGGLLLIDEIESGLHYSVQPDMWRLIFRVAEELNIQVFATTHSKDCIEAFQHIASDDPAEGVVVQLGPKGDNIVASIFDERLLGLAVRNDVEVR